jgi:hypothetical protein
MQTTDYIQAARELGIEHARNVASWVADGNTDPEGIRRVLRMLEEGDPAADDYLPRRPDLSGEWADGMTPTMLYQEITGESHADAEAEAGMAYETLVGTLLDSLCDAYEEGVADTFQEACEAELRRWVD